MVLGILLLAGIPTTVGTVTGVSRSNDENEKKRDEIRGEECHLTIHCGASSPKRKHVHGKSVVLKDDKVIIATLPTKEDYATRGHPFKGFQIGHPSGEQLRGMVSMSSVDPPSMGFVYADRNTYELKYGNKTTSTPHIHGPWDLTEDDAGLLLEDQELFVAVEEKKGYWALYYDKHGDGRYLPRGKPSLPVSIERKPKEMLDKS